ncbi:hypothetical protein SCEN_N01580 [Saccharomyces cerevisiae]|nr:hypothetical protein SCEN_N01580 [Saccharomyces cerevisiae]
MFLLFFFFFYFFFTFQFLVAFPILLFKVSLNSTLTKHVRPIHQRTKARSLTHHCIPKRWNIHFFFSGLLHKTISRIFSWIGNTRQVAPTKHTPKYLLNTI